MAKSVISLSHFMRSGAFAFIPGGSVCSDPVASFIDSEETSIYATEDSNNLKLNTGVSQSP